MTTKAEGAGARAYWFVGATYGSDDQTNKFLSEGIWQNQYQDKDLDQVRLIQPGDRIAIKASYTRKRDFPFDNRGQRVSVMAIKATGTVRKNHGDGRTLDIEWEPFAPPREWYFYPNRSTVWCVSPGDWATDALIEFTFKEIPQDINLFRNTPYLRKRFDDTPVDEKDFLWNCFYEAIADKLLQYRERRDELIEGIHSISSKIKGLSNLRDQFPSGYRGPLKDICPFTAMGIFNRGSITHEKKITLPNGKMIYPPGANRLNIATELATFLRVKKTTPNLFEGIPRLNNQNSWFFGLSCERETDDIDALWEIFAQAINFAESDNADVRADFITAFNNAIGRFNVGWRLTMGLYWARPWNFLTLDSKSRCYIKKELKIKIGRNGPKRRYNAKPRCSADDYLAVLDTLEARFQEDKYPVHSFPDLSLKARD